MKKLLLTLSLVLGFITLAQATTVTLPGAGKTWASYTWTQSGDDYQASVNGYTFLLKKAESQTALVSPGNDVRIYANANLTITAPENVTFKQVDITAASGGKATKVNAGSDWNVTINSHTDKGILTGATLTSTTPQRFITIAGTDGRSGKQMQLLTVTLTLSDGSVVTPTVEPPAFNPEAGEVKAGTEVSISCGTDDATIRYTTDGSNVVETSKVYSKPIVITEAMTIKAKAFKADMNASAEAIAYYTIKADVPSGSPVIVFKSNTNDNNQAITASTYSQQIESGAGYVKSITDISRVYPGKNGLKFSSSKEKGTLTINLVETVKCKQIIVNAQKYNSDATSLAVNECAAQTLGQTPADYIYDMKSEKISAITLAATDRLYVKSITIVVDHTPDAPVLELPAGATEPMPLDNYTNEATNNYFEVKVSWPEGLTLHYETNCRGTQLDGIALKYSQDQADKDKGDGGKDILLKYPLTGDLTGTATVSRSVGTVFATFGFASEGTFNCYVVDAAGNKSDAKEISFTGKSTGVEDIVADGEKGEAVFYNLQGVRVANPAAGNLYIKVQGDKATKVLVK